MNRKLAIEQNFKCKDMNICTVADIKAAGFDVIDAAVPGNMELDMMNNIRNICDGMKILKMY